jgi:hypothetical protein
MIDCIKKLIATKKIYWYLLSLGLIGLIFVQYYGLVHYQYAVPSGDDPMNHWWMAKPFYDGTGNFFEVLKSGGYPPAYHYLIAKIAILFNADLLETIKWTAPAILIFSSLAIFILAYTVFGIEAGLIAFFLYAFIAKTPIQLLNDGGYPNIIAAHIIFPLILTLVTCAIKAGKSIRRNKFIILAIALTLLVPIFHHTTTFYLLGIVLISLPTFITIYWVRNKWHWRKGVLLLLINFLIYFALFYAFTKTGIFASAKALSSTMIQIDTTFPFFKILGSANPDAMWTLRGYISNPGRYFSLYALIGLIGVAFAYLKNKKMFVPATIMTIWIAILFFGSRLPFLSNPERPARDMVVPLAVLAGGGIYYLLTKIKVKSIFCWLIALIIALSFVPPLKIRLDDTTSYNPMIRVTNADMEIINYLNEQRPDRVLLVTYNYYSHALLPNWRIKYNYWVPETDRSMYQFDYIYLLDSKSGWLPKEVSLGMAGHYKTRHFLTTAIKAKSPISEVYLFKVHKDLFFCPLNSQDDYIGYSSE